MRGGAAQVAAISRSVRGDGTEEDVLVGNGLLVLGPWRNGYDELLGRTEAPWRPSGEFGGCS